MVDGDERRECQPPQRVEGSARQDIVAGLQSIDRADEHEDGEKAEYEQRGCLAPHKDITAARSGSLRFMQPRPLDCDERLPAVRPRTHSRRACGSQGMGLTPRTWSSSLIPIPVPSMPMEKLALSVSPSKSAIWAVKSSFSSGVG
jgi:hypothetical protein